MDKLIALLQFVLALFGVDVGSHTLVHGAAEAGTTSVYSRTHVEAGVALFECLRSDSGQCHYALYPRTCAADADAAPDCDAAPLERFTVASGDARQQVGLPAFHLCVGADPGMQAKDCEGALRR